GHLQLHQGQRGRRHGVNRRRTERPAIGPGTWDLHGHRRGRDQAGHSDGDTVERHGAPVLNHRPGQWGGSLLLTHDRSLQSDNTAVQNIFRPGKHTHRRGVELFGVPPRQKTSDELSRFSTTLNRVEGSGLF
ncbi:MAG: hypothetical protein U1C97_02025, partial [Candidatus Gracilibacteria bacterium]|nr:hypothetical protein [Candidatus Gracilibacteria bacterium]